MDATDIQDLQTVLEELYGHSFIHLVECKLGLIPENETPTQMVFLH